jgi:hypothetical protein
MPGLQKHDLMPTGNQAVMQPLRKRPCLKPDPYNCYPKPGEESDQGLRLARHLSLPHNSSRSVSNADARALQRYVNPDIMVHHRRPPRDETAITALGLHSITQRTSHPLPGARGPAHYGIWSPVKPRSDFEAAPLSVN